MLTGPYIAVDIMIYNSQLAGTQNMQLLRLLLICGIFKFEIYLEVGFL